jgi:DNA repair protein RadC
MLYIQETNGHYRVADEDDVIAEANEIYHRYLCQGTVISQPADSADYLKLKLAQFDHEVFVGLFLNNQHQVISCDELSHGTIDGASVHVREVVKAALLHNAAAVIFAHNHPSGLAEPSEADKMITTKLKNALAMIDVRVLDHLVVGETVYSFAEHGLI